MFAKPNIDLSVDLCGVRFENPFVLAAAPPTDDLDMLRTGFKTGWAGAVLKTTSVEANTVRLKYPMMTAFDLGCEKIAALGNIDLISEHHIGKVEERIKILKNEFPEKIVIPSIMGAGKGDWQELVKRCADAGADMIECSFSCPQGTIPDSEPRTPDSESGTPKHGGWMLGQDPFLSARVTDWVKEAAAAAGRNLPVVIKLTPHVTNVNEIADAVRQAGADAVCVSNTFKALMGIDLDTLVPNPNIEGKSAYSGMSGPAIKPLTLRLVAEIASKVGIPIAASGGVTGWKDAAEFILCGAKTVQVCTAVMHHGFEIVEDLIEGLSDYLAARNLAKVSDIFGRSLQNIVVHDDLPYTQKVKAGIDSETCIRCGDCLTACRDGGHQAIKMDAARAVAVDADRCVGCGLCRLVCPVKGCISIL